MIKLLCHHHDYLWFLQDDKVIAPTRLMRSGFSAGCNLQDVLSSEIPKSCSLQNASVLAEGGCISVLFLCPNDQASL